ncbi:RNA-directed DNA polymerase, eukaryota [Tanacetum coccineum]
MLMRLNNNSSNILLLVFFSNDSTQFRYSNEVVFPTTLSHDQTAMLEAEVTNLKIKKAVWDCGSNKSPGPDGYTFEFIRKFWEVIGDDVCRAVKSFFIIGRFPKGCNPSFIGCQYKIVGKILANRLSTVMDSLISKEQSAFIRDRQILDGPMILSEVVQWCNQKKKKSMIFKIDFEKAYDSVR